VLLAVAGLAASTVRITREQEATKRALQAEIRAKEELERSLYYQRIARAAQQLAARNVGRAEELLDECIPRNGQPDLRGWEWHYLKLGPARGAVAVHLERRAGCTRRPCPRPRVQSR
jgi:hypothetical protein